MSDQSSGYAASERVASREKKYNQLSARSSLATTSPVISYTCQWIPSASMNFLVGATPILQEIVRAMQCSTRAASPVNFPDR
jgi:hypothetical protein